MVAELNDAKAELIRKSSELVQLKGGNSRLLTEIDQLTEQHNKEKDRIVEQHAQTLKVSLEEAKQRWDKVGARTRVLKFKRQPHILQRIET